MAVNIHITIIELNALHTKRQNLFQELDAVIHLLMEAKHWGLRKSRNATSLNSRFKSLDTLKVKIISVTFRRVIRTNHKKASKIWRHENIQLGGCQLRDENAHNDKSVHGVLNPTYQAGLRRDAVQPDIEAERKKRDEIEAGKSYCSRRFGGATCDDKSAQIYARFDKNDWRIQPAEFYRFHDAEVNTFGYF